MLEKICLLQRNLFWNSLLLNRSYSSQCCSNWRAGLPTILSSQSSGKFNKKHDLFYNTVENRLIGCVKDSADTFMPKRNPSYDAQPSLLILSCWTVAWFLGLFQCNELDSLLVKINIDIGMCCLFVYRALDDKYSL